MEKLLSYKGVLREVELNVLVMRMSHVHPDGVEAVPGNTGVASRPVEIEKINIAERQPLQSVRDVLEIIFIKIGIF